MIKKAYVFLLILFFGIFLVNVLVFAKTNTADLGSSASSTYTFDNTKIEFSGDSVGLKATTNWYNSSWGFRDQITVTNYTGVALTDYPVKVSLTSTSVNFWSKVESGGASVRFTNSDGTTLIDHYIESFDYSGTTSTIWVKIPSLAAHTSTTIYLYYTNSGASDTSNGNNVFTFFDNFASDTIDATKWVELDTYNVISATGGSLLMEAYEGNLWHGIYATTSYAVDRSNGLILEGDVTTFNTLNKDQNFIFGLKDTTASASAAAMINNFKYSFYFNGAYHVSNPFALYADMLVVSGNNWVQINTTYNFRIVVYPGGGADYFIKGGYFTDWTLVYRSTVAYSGSLEVAIDKQEGKYVVDNVRVRKLSMPANSTAEVFPRYSTTTPVFTTTTDPVWGNDQGIGEVDVLYEDGIFKMWYSASTSVAYATSSNGINWNRYANNPVFSPTGVTGNFDKTWANRQFIVKDAGIFYMYYNGFENGYDGAGKIGLATSTDGINWNRYSGNPVLSPGSGWENTSLYNSAVVKVGSIWYLLFEGKGSGDGDSTQIIGLATSTDGINWNRYANNPIIRKGFPTGNNYAAAPNLIYNNGKFYIWIMGSDIRSKYFLVRGESTDAINWTFASTPDIFPQYSWEYTSVSDASIPIEVGGSTYMYYTTGNQVGVTGGAGLMKYNGTLNALLNSSTPFSDAAQVLVSTSSLYSATSPSVVSPGVAYDKITAFSATTTGTGSVVYQISNNGSSWYYWNGSAWAAASNSAQSNAVSVVNTNITAFSDTFPSGTFYWKAYFVSDGSQTVSMTALSSVTNIFPTVTIETISGFKQSSVTINYNLIDPDNDVVNFSQTATSGVEFSLDGNTWADATSSSTGDGLTGLSSTSSPGQAHTFIWDSIADASTTESNVVYLRFRANDGLDFGASWTTSSLFGLDNAAPSSVGAPTFGTIASTSIEVVKPSVVTESGSGLNQWQVRRDGATLESAVATSTNSVTVNNLLPNTSYAFDVRFTDAVTNTSTFGTSTTQYTNAASPVSPVVSSVSTSSVLISWGENSNPTTTVYRVNGDNGFSSVTTTATSTTLTGLISNKNYTFNVQSQNFGDSSYNSAVAASVITTLPQNPSSPTVSDLSASSLTLSWGENNNATTTVYQVSATGFSSVTTTATSSSITGLTPNTVYTFAVKAYYASDNTTLTSGVSATATNTTPQAPVSATVSSISTSSLVLSWGANSNNSLTVYEISEPDVVPSFTTVTSTGTSTTITGLTPNTSYTFNVKARNYSIPSSLTSAATASATGTLSILPTSPVVSSVNTSTLSLTWGANNNPTSTVYQISATGFTSVTTTATSSNITGLTPNTSYTFTVKTQNPDTSYNAGIVATVTTTLANVPSLVAATVNSHSQITISWSGDATDYYVENITAGTNSDWQSSTQKIFSNLACDTTYVFRVKGRNSDQINTDWSSEVNARTFGCGSSFVVAPPTVPISSLAVTLDAKQTLTNSVSVTLSLSAKNAKQMAISNSADFYGVSWEEYNSTKKWNLLPGSGPKIVYVKFRSADGGVSDTYKLNLMLNEQDGKIVQNTDATQTVVEQKKLNLNIKNSDKYTAGSVLQLSYKYINNTKNIIKVRVTRELLDSKNKVIKTANGKATLKPGGNFTNNTKEKLPTNLKVGDYSVRVRFYNQQTGKLIVQEVQKLKIVKKK